MLSLEQLKKMVPAARMSDLARACDPLNAAMEEFLINSRQRQAAFISQLAHESDSFLYVRELASGDSYEGREDLGNTEPGDGRRFKGWGWMQTTGRKNTGIVSVYLYGDNRLVEQPELISPPSPELCARAAGHFWKIGAGQNLSRRAREYGVPVGCDLNDLADAGDFKGITLAVNGGLTHLAERERFYALAMKTLDDGGVA